MDKRFALIRTALSGLVIIVAVIYSAEAENVLKFRAKTLRTDSTQEIKSQIRALGVADELSTEYFVVQFKSDVGLEARNVIQAHGGAFLRYIPEKAILARFPKGRLQGLTAHSLVQAVVPYLAEFKISPDFGPRNVFNAQTPSRALVLLQDLKASEEIRKLPLNIKAEVGNTLVVDATLGLIEKVAQIEGVEYVEPYFEPELMHIPLENSDKEPAPKPAGDIQSISEYASGTKIMNVTEAWNRGFVGETEVVSFADTGLDSGSIPTLKSDFSNTQVGLAFGMFSADWSDPMGHGTHVAGSIAGNGSLSQGRVAGPARKSRIVAEGMWSPIFNNLTVPPQIASLFKGAYAQGARIHSNSWGSPKNLGAYDAFAAQVDEYVFNNPDFLILFAAGNSGGDLNKDGKIDGGSISSPGTAKNILTVGASENLILEGGLQKKLKDAKGGADKWSVAPLAEDMLSDHENGIAGFSSRGPTLDGRIKPEVVAPGTNILSNCSSVPNASKLWGEFNADYCWSGGTSMATPLTAGVAALTREFLKSKGFASPSAALIKASLMASADDLFPGQFGEGPGQELLTPAPNNDEGYGRVNAERATSAEAFLSIVDQTDGLSEGTTFETSIEIKSPTSVKITLVYTDAPGAPSAAQSLVNDLDLSVQVGDSESILVSESRVDNKEQITIKNIDAANLKIRVKAIRLAQTNARGKAPFALVVHRLPN